jgi:hypothetical protein
VVVVGWREGVTSIVGGGDREGPGQGVTHVVGVVLGMGSRCSQGVVWGKGLEGVCLFDCTPAYPCPGPLCQFQCMSLLQSSNSQYVVLCHAVLCRNTPR